MIHRIVRLKVKDEDSRLEFERIYKNRNPFKNGVKGCRMVKVMHDINEENIYYTVSLWDTNEDLEAYRQSKYFAETWPMVKEQLAQKAEAFSMEEIEHTS